MTEIMKYNEVFMKLFKLEPQQLHELKYQDVIDWDSIGHMELMTVLESTFSIQMDIDDIIDFSSYQKGIEILGKYGVQFDS